MLLITNVQFTVYYVYVIFESNGILMHEISLL